MLLVSGWRLSCFLENPYLWSRILQGMLESPGRQREEEHTSKKPFEGIFGDGSLHNLVNVPFNKGGSSKRREEPTHLPEFVTNCEATIEATDIWMFKAHPQRLKYGGRLRHGG